MDPLTQALRGSRHASPAPLLRAGDALVVGAGGTLGSAVLAEALGVGRFQRVAAVAAGALRSALRGFDTVPAAALLGMPTAPTAPSASSASSALTAPTAPTGPLAAGFDTAFIVFERARHANGRDEAFFQPEPAMLPAIAAALLAIGVRRLLVVLPHAPALLPAALQHGLATLDENTVAALGFEQLVFVRAAQQGAAKRKTASRADAFAAWWLSQLNWMVPTREQPVRAVQLAALVVQLARLLPAAKPATRVLPSDVLWQAAHAGSAAAASETLAHWLAGAGDA